MRIGIDYTAAVRQGGGIGRYTRNLVRALAELDAENDYTLFVAGGWGEGDGLGPWPVNFRVRSVPFSDRWVHLLWQRLRLPIPVQAVTGSLDLFHSPDFVLPPTGRTPALLTVHDLSFLRVPECYVPAFRRYLEGAVARATSQADHILADSESTKRDLEDLLEIEPQRVTVLYPGVEDRFQPIRTAEVLRAARERYALPEHFVLGLSTIQPRKNFAGLLEGYRRLVQSRSHDPAVADLQLVIAGGKGWMVEDALAALDEPGLRERVHLTGFFADKDLPALYNLAAVFAFPSWYEGFGLPVLEAMACGTPVVCADNSSLPEVAAGAALIVDAADTDALTEALYRVLCEDDLRTEMASAGLEKAKAFSWSRAARQLLAMYRSLV